MKRTLFLLILLAITPLVLSADYELTIQEKDLEIVQGEKTSMYTVNNESPGPLIKGVEGQRIEVEVTNKLSEPTSMHWHGLQLNNTMDGVPGLTQEAIRPGETFTYTLDLKNAGTYWYHSHKDSARQVEKGIQGPLIIEKEDDPYGDLDQEVLVLDDIRLDQNGDHVRFGIGAMHGRFGNTLLVNGEINPTITIPEGYSRLRIANTANARVFNIRVPNAETTVIGEGINYLEEPKSKNIISIQPSDRADIILKADEPTTLEHVTRRDIQSLAQLKPEGDGVEDVTFQSFEDPYLDICVADNEADIDVELRGQRTRSGLEWTINGKSSERKQEVFEVKEGKLYTMKLTNTNGQPHPMHLHGQKVKVIKRDGEPVDSSWRDTVYVGGNSEVKVLFRAEGKGDWAFHCHILEHAMVGMSSTMKVT